jgi:diadenosine tetraphosphate (Ap4A) HIT family hydrolase
MNYAALSNVSPVIHMHIVPRYKEPRTFQGAQFIDTRWGKNYAPYDNNFVIELPVLLKIKEAIQKELR